MNQPGDLGLVRRLMLQRSMSLGGGEDVSLTSRFKQAANRLYQRLGFEPYETTCIDSDCKRLP